LAVPVVVGDTPLSIFFVDKISLDFASFPAAAAAIAAGFSTLLPLISGLSSAEPYWPSSVEVVLDEQPIQNQITMIVCLLSCCLVA
jgi:hypothetical protein